MDKPTLALIIGGAACVWDDVKRAQRLASFDTVIAVNDAGAAWPRHLDYWISLHPEKFGSWADKRAENGFAPPDHFVAHSGDAFPYRQEMMRFPYTWPGSSGLFACEFAIKHLRIDRIVLCGVPMNADPHFFDKKPWVAVKGFWDAWPGVAYRHIKDRVRSMSGRTKELLGEPSRQWLERAD